MDIAYDPEDEKVDLVKTVARYNVDPPPPEKKTLMAQIKEGAGNLIKENLPKVADQLVGGSE